MSSSDFILRAHDRDLTRGAGILEAEFQKQLVLQQPSLNRLVQRLLGWPGAHSDVEDVVQEVLVSAWMHRRRFRGDSALGTWLVKIAINQARRHRRRRRLFARIFRGSVELADVAAKQRVDADSEELRRAMARLSHGDREILVLHYLEGRSVAEVTQLLGLRSNTAHARMSRARRRLGLLLGEGSDS